ncbi:glycerophosphoryl diester phosphodiesterase [Lentisphaera araneosa HTCC2155]|uniref:Glycerophosphoryl diester phosphodiesterase n=1 Tax=Lentisphaera araneosa HTCC2155 TaxID=313628 RepID=A6DKT0_9BACT|nr:glycerophosphodiester phosphodiesterase [Lentisphaera araneosa]EDM27978.1 glycerophosphoryl diester phosphodiesterase [Lentisphaera araneosa HTCC2155]
MISKSSFLITLALLISSPLFAETFVVAHRGASKQAPENTLPAFDLAWKHDADAIEADFRLTKDGHVVCIHDQNTKRTAGKNLIVAKSTLSELQKLDVGSFKGKQFKGTKIPTIEEVFASIPKGKKIFIEIKSGPETLEPIIKALNNSSLKPEQIAIISFKEKILLDVKKHAPHIYTSWLCNIKKKRGKPSPSFDSVLKTLKDYKIDGLSTSHNHLNTEMIQTLQNQGTDCHVWTINDARQAKKFIEWGVDSITTDIPHSISKP